MYSWGCRGLYWTIDEGVSSLACRRGSLSRIYVNGTTEEDIDGRTVRRGLVVRSWIGGACVESFSTRCSTCLKFGPCPKTRERISTGSKVQQSGRRLAPIGTFVGTGTVTAGVRPTWLYIAIWIRSWRVGRVIPPCKSPSHVEAHLFALIS